MIKAAVFDLDNTLFSYDRANTYGMAAVYRYGLETLGLEETTFQEYYLRGWKLAEARIGTDTAAIHNRMLRFQCMAELLRIPLFPHVPNLYRLYWDTFLEHMELSPGITGFLENLKAHGVRIGIGTDMTAQIQYRKLERLGISSLIDTIVTSEEAGVEKPSPAFFDLCVKKAGCRPEECLFIGDNITKDVQGAIDNGLHGIWYAQENTPDRRCPFPVISSFQELTLENLPLK